MRAWTIDSPDERLKHAPRLHVEQYEGDLSGQEKDCLRCEETSVFSGDFCPKCTKNMNRIDMQDTRTVSVGNKTVKGATTMKKNGNGANGDKKAKVGRPKKAAYLLKVGKVQDKKYNFESKETENISDILDFVKVQVTKGHKNGVREVIISVRG